MNYSFTVQGKPQGKQRPRVTKGGKHTYTPQATKDYQNVVNICYKGPYFPEKPLYVTMVCYYPIPKATSMKKRKLMLEGKLRPIVMPDIDNVAKCILDALNKKAYKDDNLVVQLCISKFYGEPKVEVSIND